MPPSSLLPIRVVLLIFSRLPFHKKIKIIYSFPELYSQVLLRNELHIIMNFGINSVLIINIHLLVHHEFVQLSLSRYMHRCLLLLAWSFSLVCIREVHLGDCWLVALIQHSHLVGVPFGDIHFNWMCVVVSIRTLGRHPMGQVTQNYQYYNILMFAHIPSMLGISIVWPSPRHFNVLFSWPLWKTLTLNFPKSANL